MAEWQPTPCLASGLEARSRRQLNDTFPIMADDMRAILFDVDGVLLNSSAAHRRIWSEWAAGVGLDFETVWAASHGRRISETLADVASHLDASIEEANIRRIKIAEGDAFPAMRHAQELLLELPSGMGCCDLGEG